MDAAAAIRKSPAPLALAVLAGAIAWCVRGLVRNNRRHRADAALSAEIAKGKAALQQCLDSQTDVLDAMRHPDLGLIDFRYGTPARGLAHAKRAMTVKADYYGDDRWSIRVLEHIPAIIMRGEKSHAKGGALKITHAGRCVILSKTHDRQPSKHWVVTVFPIIAGQTKPTWGIEKELRAKKQNGP